MTRYKKNLAINITKVLSYGTHVATIDYANRTLTVLGYYSQTTSKHINYVAKTLGLTIN